MPKTCVLVKLNRAKQKVFTVLLLGMFFSQNSQAIVISAELNQPLVFSEASLASVDKPWQEPLLSENIDFDRSFTAAFYDRFYSLYPFYVSRKLEFLPGSHLCSAEIFSRVDEDIRSSDVIQGIEVVAQEQKVILNLREGVEFVRYEGRGDSLRMKATSADLKFSIELRHKLLAMQFYKIPEGIIKNMNILSDSQLEVVWGDPYSFSDLITHLSFVGLSLYSQEQYGSLLNLETVELIESSPLRFELPFCSFDYVVLESDQNGREITYERIDNSWLDRVLQHRSSFKTYSFTYIADFSSAIQLYQAGLINWITSIEKSRIDRAFDTATRPAGQMTLKMGADLSENRFVRLNTHRLSEPLRKAIFEIAYNYELYTISLDAQSLPLDSFFPIIGEKDPMAQFLTPSERDQLKQQYGLEFGESPMIKKISRKPERRNRSGTRAAVTILLEAGFERNDRGEFLDPQTKEPIEVVALTLSDNEKFYHLMRPAFEQAGLRLKVALGDGSQVTNRLLQGDFDIYILRRSGRGFFGKSFLRNIFHSASQFGFNYGVDDAKMDQLIELLDQAKGFDESLLLIKAIDQYAVERGYYIPLFAFSAEEALFEANFVPRRVYRESLSHTGGPNRYYQERDWAFVKSE